MQKIYQIIYSEFFPFLKDTIINIMYDKTVKINEKILLLRR